MTRSARLLALAILGPAWLMAGCSGRLRNPESRFAADPVRLPGAPKLAAPATAPDASMGGVVGTPAEKPAAPSIPSPEPFSP